MNTVLGSTRSWYPCTFSRHACVIEWMASMVIHVGQTNSIVLPILIRTLTSLVGLLMNGRSRTQYSLSFCFISSVNGGWSLIDSSLRSTSSTMCVLSEAADATREHARILGLWLELSAGHAIVVALGAGPALHPPLLLREELAGGPVLAGAWVAPSCYHHNRSPR